MTTQNRQPISSPLMNFAAQRAATLLALQMRAVVESTELNWRRENQINANATSAPVVVTLPLGDDSIVGLPFYALKSDSTANSVSLATQGGNLIEGEESIAVTAQHDRIGVYWDGTMYRRLAAAVAVGDAAAGKFYGSISTLVGATGETGSIELPAGTITRISVTPNDAVDDNAVVTFSIDATPIVGGVVTLAVPDPANVAKAVTPSDDNTTSEGSVLSWVVSGDNAVAAKASIRIDVA